MPKNKNNSSNSNKNNNSNTNEARNQAKSSCAPNSEKMQDSNRSEKNRFENN